MAGFPDTPDPPPPSAAAESDATLAARRAQLRALFRDLFQFEDKTLLDGLESELTFVSLQTGDTLFREGEPSDSLYFVVSGRLRATRHDRPQAIGEIARGETVGELGLITGEPRSATVSAVRKTLVARMTDAVFAQVLTGRAAISIAVMRTIIRRFRSTERRHRAGLRPAVLVVLPLRESAPGEAVARSLVETLATYGDRVATLSSRDIADLAPAEVARAADPRGPVMRRIEAVEAESTTLVLLADAKPTPWTQACLSVADEILLVARAAEAPAVSPVEAEWIDGERAGHAPEQTLVLVHEPGTIAPSGTAAWLDRRSVSRHVHVRIGVGRDMRRLARIVSGRAIGLVLSGGGARGLAHVGVLNALAEAGIEIDVIGGTSIGSAIGGLRAMDPPPQALGAATRRIFVESGSPTGDYNILPFVSLVSGRKTRRITEAAVLEVAGRPIDVEDTWITFFCMAGNYSTAKEAILSRGPLSKCLLASFAIPGALPPIIIGGDFYVDGGTVNNLPVDVMESYRVGRIIAVDLLADTIRQVTFDWVPGTLALLADRIRRRSARKFQVPSLPEMLVNASVLPTTGHQRDMRARADICFRPKLERVRLLDWRKYDLAVRAGYDNAKEQLDAMDPATLAGYR